MRLLFVDDDPDARALAIRALAQEFPNAEYGEAVDAEGLDRALREGLPDILVTDFDLRWTTGLDIFDRVKAAAPECCAVMFTGTGNEELAVQAMKHGFDDYVVKGSHQLRRLATSARLAYERARERRELGENRDLILKELYHRLHNNLQIVVSLIRMTGKALKDPDDRDQLDRLGRRIQALGSLQEAFYRSPNFRRVDFGRFLEELADDIREMLPDQVALELAIEPVNLPVDLATPLALCANELLANAARHAFPGERRGTIGIGLALRDEAVVLTVEDDGVGFVGGEAPSGLGMKLVRRLAGQIEADISLERKEAGARWRISVPAPTAS